MHDMRVRSADAECADAGAARTLPSFPFRSFAIDAKWTVLEIKVWIGLVEMKRRRKYAMSHDVRGVDQPGHAGGDIQMPDIGLRRADCAELLPVRSCAKSLGQACELDRITQRRPGAVRFDVANGFRLNPRGLVRHRDDVGLPFHARRRVADLCRTVIVDGETANDRVNLVAVAYRIVQRASASTTPDSTAKNGPLGIGVECPAVTIRRHHAAILIVIAALLRKRNRSATGQRHIALVGQKRLARLRDGKQRGRARRQHGEARTAQIQLVGDPRRQKIEAVAHHLEVIRQPGSPK